MATTEVTYNVVITLMYTDATTRNITFGGVETTELGKVKQRVKTINASVPEDFKKTFVSAGGAECMRISDAKLVGIQEEVIYDAS